MLQMVSPLVDTVYCAQVYDVIPLPIQHLRWISLTKKIIVMVVMSIEAIPYYKKRRICMLLCNKMYEDIIIICVMNDF